MSEEVWFVLRALFGVVALIAALVVAVAFALHGLPALGTTLGGGA